MYTAKNVIWALNPGTKERFDWFCKMYDELMVDFEDVKKKWRSCPRKEIGVLVEIHNEDTDV